MQFDNTFLNAINWIVMHKTAIACSIAIAENHTAQKMRLVLHVRALYYVVAINC